MNVVFLLLTTGMGVGSPLPEASSSSKVIQVGYESQPASKPGLFARFRGLFRKSGSCNCGSDPGSAVIVPVPASQPHIYPTPAPAPAPLYNHKPSTHSMPAPGHVYQQPGQLPVARPMPASGQPGTGITAPIPAKPLNVGSTQSPVIQQVNPTTPKVEQGTRLVPQPVVGPAASKEETQIKNPF